MINSFKEGQDEINNEKVLNNFGQIKDPKLTANNNYRICTSGKKKLERKEKSIVNFVRFPVKFE